MLFNIESPNLLSFSGANPTLIIDMNDGSLVPVRASASFSFQTSVTVGMKLIVNGKEFIATDTPTASLYRFQVSAPAKSLEAAINRNPYFNQNYTAYALSDTALTIAARYEGSQYNLSGMVLPDSDALSADAEIVSGLSQNSADSNPNFELIINILTANRTGFPAIPSLDAQEYTTLRNYALPYRRNGKYKIPLKQLSQSEDILPDGSNFQLINPFRAIKVRYGYSDSDTLASGIIIGETEACHVLEAYRNEAAEPYFLQTAHQGFKPLDLLYAGRPIYAGQHHQGLHLILNSDPSLHTNTSVNYQVNWFWKSEFTSGVVISSSPSIVGLEGGLYITGTWAFVLPQEAKWVWPVVKNSDDDTVFDGSSTPFRVLNYPSSHRLQHFLLKDEDGLLEILAFPVPNTTYSQQQYTRSFRTYEDMELVNRLANAQKLWIDRSQDPTQTRWEPVLEYSIETPVSARITNLIITLQ